MTQHVHTKILGTDYDLQITEGLTARWTVLLRLVLGYYFLHAGVTKFAFVSGEAFDASGWLVNGTAGAPAPIHAFLVWAASTPAMLAFTNFMIPVGETLIGLGILLGVLTRLAAFFGTFLMAFFYLGGADWAHGYVNGDLFILLAFVTVAVLGAGRVLGLDAYLEQLPFVENRPVLRYLLG